MKVWLDDERPMPEYFDVHVKRASEAIKLLESGQVTHISLDHDLGDTYACPENCGYEVAKWIEQAAFDGRLKRIAIMVHTQNQPGRRVMCQAAQKAIQFWKDQECQS